MTKFASAFQETLVHSPLDMWPEIRPAHRCGEPLRRELEGLRKYRVRRFRIIYATDHKAEAIRLMAVGHRRSIYEELMERIRKKG